MLPGFRFLFAAIMLSMSLLVFGLGAASLLRAAHQAFASNSSWRGGPDVTFAPRADNPPMLASLRVDPPAFDRPLADAAAVTQTAGPIETTPSNAISAPARLAAQKIENASPVEAVRTEAVKTEGVRDRIIGDSNRSDSERAEMPVAVTAAEAAPQLADVAIGPDGAAPRAITIAALASPQATPATAEPPMIQVEPAVDTTANSAATNALTATGADSSPAKIATLGGPAVVVDPETPAREKIARPEQAKADQDATRKRVRRAANRRRLARARLLAQQQLWQQQQATAILQPFPELTPAVTPAPKPAVAAAARHHRQAAVKPAP